MRVTPDRKKLVAILAAVSGSGAAGLVSTFNLSGDSEWEDVTFASSWPITGTRMPVSISPDSSLVAFPEPDGTAEAWDLETIVNVHDLKGDDDVVLDLTFSADSRFLVLAIWAIAPPSTTEHESNGTYLGHGNGPPHI